MKNVIKMVLKNLVIFVMMYFVFLNDEYEFYLKAFLYVNLFLHIISMIYLIGVKEILEDEKIKDLLKRRSNKYYMYVDYFLDFIFLIGCIIMGYKVIFVIYLFTVFLNMTLYGKKEVK